MKIEPFLMERMQSQWENRVRNNLSESGVHPMTVGELLGPDGAEDLLARRLVYVQSNGTDELRETIAGLYPDTGPGNIVVCNGTAEANYISIWRLVEPGDQVVLMLPNYMQIWGVLRGQGAEVVPLPLRQENDWNLDLDDLDRAVTPRTRMIVVCNPNNPTGSILSTDAMRAIAAAAAKSDAWIVSDEVYRGAEREGPETPSFRGLHDRVLVTCGLSKAYGLPGLRIGWVVGPEETIAELWARKDYLTIAPGALSEALARAALRPETRHRIIDRTRGILNRNFPVLQGWVRERASTLKMIEPRAGAIAFIQYGWRINSTALVERLREEKGVLVVPGDHFGMDGYLRIGFGGEPQDLAEGLNSMAQLVDSFRA